MQTNYTLSPQDLENLLKKLIKGVESVQRNINQQASQNLAAADEKLNRALSSLEEAEARLNLEATKNKNVSQSEIRTLTRMVTQAIADMKAAIPEPADLTPLEERINEAVASLEAQIPKLPEELTAEKTRDKLEGLTGDERLKLEAIRGLEDLIEDIKKLKERPATVTAGRALLQLYVNGAKKGAVQYLNITGSGVTYNNANGRNDVNITGGSGSLSVLAATGTVNDANTSFTFPSEPTLVIVNGATYRHGFGCTIAGTSVTLDNPPGTGGDVYGLG